MNWFKSAFSKKKAVDLEVEKEISDLKAEIYDCKLWNLKAEHKIEKLTKRCSELHSGIISRDKERLKFRKEIDSINICMDGIYISEQVVNVSGSLARLKSDVAGTLERLTSGINEHLESLDKEVSDLNLYIKDGE